MERIKYRNILVMVGCLVMILPPSGIAGDGIQWGSTPSQAYNREIPALSSNCTSTSDQIPLSVGVSSSKNSAVDSWGNDSPLYSPDDKASETPQTLTEEEADKVLDLLSETLDTLRNDSKLSATLAQSFAEASSAIRNYIQGASSENGKPSALEIFQNVNKILDNGRLIAPATGSPEASPSAGPVRRFAIYILANVQALRERMTEDASLSEAKIFSAGESPAALRDERPPMFQEVNRTLRKNYQVLSSVVMDRRHAKTYELLNPPQKLHPFIRWLCYGRHLTSIRAERYLAACAKVKAIFLRAKAGEGLIRYNGRIMEYFLPLPGNENGSFELVRRM